MFKGRNDWEDIWDADRKNILNTMVRNMVADLANGYDYFGTCISKQRYEIDLFQKKYADQLMVFATMTEEAVNKWCYYDLKRRGAID